jgi:hypothetical protein
VRTRCTVTAVLCVSLAVMLTPATAQADGAASPTSEIVLPYVVIGAFVVVLIAALAWGTIWLHRRERLDELEQEQSGGDRRRDRPKETE